MKKLASLLLLCLVFAAPAQAKLYLNSLLAPTLGSSDGGSTTSATSVSSSSIGLDSRTSLGFYLGKKLVLGAAVNFITAGTSSGGISSGSSTDLEVGPTIGFSNGRFHLTFAYFLLANSSTKSGIAPAESTTTDKGTGFQGMMGYCWKISDDFSLGPAVVYRSVSYKKQTSTASGDQDYQAPKTESLLEPMISVMIDL